jgi:CHAT domain-containing protein
MVRTLGDAAKEGILLNDIGYVYRRMGRYAEASRSVRTGLQLAESIEAVQLALYCYWTQGDIERDQKHWPEAAAAYRAAIQRTEQVRAGSREPALQTSFLDRHSTPYHELVRCLVELGQPEEAFAVSEQAKARALVDILQQGKAVIRRGLSTEERQEEQRLDDRLTALEVQLEDRKISSAQRTRVYQELVRTRQDHEAFRRTLYLRHPDLSIRRAAFAPGSLLELQHDLFQAHPQLVILSYVLREQESYLFVLTAGSDPAGPAHLTVHRLNVDARQLAETVREFREVCAHSGLAPASDDLYRWLLAPAEEELRRARQVVIVPDGVLHTLPFQALRSIISEEQEGPYLIERCAVSYAPSATALRAMVRLSQERRQHYRVGLGGLLAIGIRDFGGRAPTLPQAEREARVVAGMFGTDGQELLARQATKAAVRAVWEGRRYLHFATHGQFNEGAPLYSALVLSRRDGRDEGLLFGQDLLDENLTAELAVLSACETGLGKNTNGEGLQGLVWSWFVAGVPASVASQWSVADDSTRRFMEVFYQALKAGSPKAEALRQAQLALLKDRPTRHPFYWAPFVLNGDPW